MELRDLLLLLYTARDSFTSVEVVWEYEYDEKAMSVALERWSSQQPFGSVTTLKSTGSETSAAFSVTTILRQVWWKKPACWRDEIGTKSKIITIICNGIQSTFTLESDALDVITESSSEEHSQMRELYSSTPPNIEDRLDDISLLDPSFLLASHTLSPLQEMAYLGRDVIKVRATHRKGRSRIYGSLFWGIADEYEILIDKEHGILLRYAAKLAEQEFAVASVKYIIFDKSLPEHVFFANFRQS